MNSASSKLSVGAIMAVLVGFSPVVNAQPRPDDADAFEERCHDESSDDDFADAADSPSVQTRRHEAIEQLRRRTCNFGSSGPVCRAEIRDRSKNAPESTRRLSSPAGAVSMDVSTTSLAKSENQSVERELRRAVPELAKCADMAFYEDNTTWRSLRVVFMWTSDGESARHSGFRTLKIVPGDATLQKCVKNAILGLSVPASVEDSISVDARFEFRFEEQPNQREPDTTLKTQMRMQTKGLRKDERDRIESLTEEIETCVTNTPVSVPSSLQEGEVEFEAEYCNGLRKVSITSSTAPTWVDNCVLRTVWCAEKHRRLSTTSWTGTLEYSR
jgi:hypothetical protein